MKCTVCGLRMGEIGYVVTLVSLGPRSYSATLHDWCLQSLIGQANERKLQRIAFDSGWAQPGLPGFGAEVAAP